MKVVVHCTSNRVSAPLITSPSPMTGSGGIFAQTAAVLERNVLMRSLLLCGCGVWKSGCEVWKTLREVWKTLCGG